MIDRLAAIAAINALPDVIPANTPTPSSPPIASPIRKLASGLNHEYSTMWPVDEKGRAVLLQHPDGFFGLHYLDADKFGQLYDLLPPEINHASQPRWMLGSDTDWLLYLYLDEIRRYNAGTRKIETLHRFDLPNINGMGESDISEDGNHLVLCSGLRVFVYELSSGTLSGVFDAPTTFNSLYVTPDNRPLVGLYGGLGVQVLNAAGVLRKVAGGVPPHMDVSSDENGSPILVWCNSGDDTGPGRSAALQGCPNGVQLTYLDGSRPDRCLLSLDWRIAFHISLPKRASYALVSTYIESDPESAVQYANENLLVGFDGSVRSLGKHGADSSTYYGKPRATISPDGKTYFYDSRGDVYFGNTE